MIMKTCLFGRFRVGRPCNPITLHRDLQNESYNLKEKKRGSCLTKILRVKNIASFSEHLLDFQKSVFIG